jgi:hypothetical protein
MLPEVTTSYPPDQPPGRSAEAVEADRPEHHRYERERSWDRVAFGQSGEGRAHHDSLRAVLLLSNYERRKTREQFEVNAESIATSRPRLAAIGVHPKPGDEGVDERGKAKSRRIRRGVVGELERSEQEQEQRCRPATEPLRVRGGLPALTSASSEPCGRVGSGAPRAQHPPDVAQKDHDRHEPEPEDDPDECRAQVYPRVLLAEEAGGEHDEEECERHRPCGDSKAGGQQESLQGLGQRAAVQSALESRLPPESAERRERQHEDDGPSVVEEPERYRQVLHRAESVRGSSAW